MYGVCGGGVCVGGWMGVHGLCTYMVCVCVMWRDVWCAILWQTVYKYVIVASTAGV